MQQHPPSPQQQYAQQPYFPQQQPPATSGGKGYAIASLCFLLVGIALHLLAFFPILGIMFGCISKESHLTR